MPSTPPSTELLFNILIVDDDRSVAYALDRALTEKGHTVNLAFSAEEGLQTLKDAPVDIVLLDLFMPGMDGMAFLASFVKGKIVNFHGFMTGACKLLWNQVYSRLLGDRNECNERSQPDVLLEGGRRSTQTQQWDAA